MVKEITCDNCGRELKKGKYDIWYCPVCDKEER